MPLLFLWNEWDVYLLHGTAWEKLTHMCTKQTHSLVLQSIQEAFFVGLHMPEVSVHSKTIISS